MKVVPWVASEEVRKALLGTDVTQQAGGEHADAGRMLGTL